MTTTPQDPAFALPKALLKDRQVFFAGAATRTIDEEPTPTISLRSTVKTFGFGDTVFQALDGIDLEIQRGEFVAIMGPSGCGKTTLLNILGLLDKPSAGEYFLNSKSVAKLSAARKARIRGREVGFIFQNFNLIPTLNVLDNVALPLTYQRGLKFNNLEKASKILKTFDLQNREYYLPNQLSGGQTQRVAIARALINNPSIILADEPTGNLDSKNSEIIMDELTRLHRAGNTILMVTHNPDLLSYASRVIHMKDGQIDRDIELTDTAAYKATTSFISQRKKQRSRRFRNGRLRRQKEGEKK
ncbi:ABC transporter ATP-binding protein [Candidatus Saccharibacteria bacterium]|nr:ABC transporter ATP-binding protein [Candidatus Saccharibacteria bacterium]